MDLSSTSNTLPAIKDSNFQNGELKNQNGSLNGFDYQKGSFQIPKVKGKFIYVGDKKFYVRGVSYGAFKPDENKNEYQDLEKLDNDFALMVENGINTVRIPHTTPPRHLLDIAHKYGLKVMIGLSAEQYVGYLIDKNKSFNIKKIIREKVKICKDHPALLCISIGNEISSSMVRWIGPKKIEKYLEGIYNLIKSESPDSIVTYVNYPTTEYLQLPFLDLLCFNVYLENQSNFENYLYKLQNIAGNRPLLMGEIGLDSLRNGEEIQAQTLEWQIRSTFTCGCAGLFIFSWTDEWYRGEEEVDDWAFGLTTKTREPKQALNLVSHSFRKSPFSFEANVPKISVIVCVYNGASTLTECLQGLQNLNYSNYEVLVINDGSTDNTLDITSSFDFKIITTQNLGLSYARNLGLEKSQGEIVAYIDVDAYPDPDWLSYLAIEFNSSEFAAIGGPNISPEKVGLISECVNNAPGSPTQVLLTDRTAEHIPGCNMAFRRDRLLEIGGFDSQFRIAGDDVDVCWKLQENGKTVGFSPAAIVWHYRRNTVKGFWKQQYCYGKAEALLEQKWPKKYNNFGHRNWEGRIYGDGTSYLSSLNKSRIYGGVWGSAPFQSIYDIGKRNLLSFTLMPEWFIICVTLLILSSFGLLWKPLLLLVPLSILFALLPLVIIIPSITNLNPPSLRKKGWFVKKKFQFLTTTLYMIQPLARLFGRLNNNLTPWRRFNRSLFSPIIYGKISVWCEKWISPEIRLENLESDLDSINSSVYRGGDFDRWDLGIKGGAFGGIRVLMAAEDHSKANQYLRYKIFPKISPLSKYLVLFASIIITLTIIDKSWVATVTFTSLLLLLLMRIFWDCSIASGCCLNAIEKQKEASGE